MRFKVNESDAAASLNAIFVKIIDKVDKTIEGKEFIYWARKLTTNFLIDEYRKEKRKLSVIQSMDPFDLGNISHQPQLNEAELSLDAQEIIRLIQQLKDPGRTIFNLHAIDGYSHGEIAEKLNITSENSRYHLHASRKILRNKMSVMIKHTKIS